jgi:xanthine dehydrogenase small subunit
VPEIVRFRCNGASVDVEVAPGETLLSVLRERLHITSAKDGCAPQGQCGCCTVLVDGDARVACVTPATRVQDRSVTTVEGLDQGTRDQLAQAFVDTGGSQCGFCTPGIVMRAAALLEKGKTAPHHLERALAAHLCRCTGWRTVSDAILVCAEGGSRRPLRAQTGNGRGLDAAGRRAVLEGGAPQRVGADVPVGGGGFADDRAPRDALVAVPLPPGSSAPAVEAAGLQWVVAETLLDARAAAAKVQGRRTTIEERPPLELPPCPTDGVRLATSWVEPAYLEPDASWCEPGGEPATPLANGGAFGGKETSPVAAAARELADHSGRTVRVLLAREDVVRLGPKRSPIAAAAHVDGSTVRIAGTVAGRAGSSAFFSPVDRWPYDLAVEAEWDVAEIPGPPTGPHLRAAGLAEHVVLLEGALAAARAERGALATDERAAAVLLDTCAPAPAGSAALAGARVELAPDTGALSRVEVRVAAGDVLDAVVLRSYATGAAHMALGWVLTEGLAVDPETGEVHDLTIRSFDIIRAKDTPPIDVTILEDPGPPCPRSSDAVFAAVAAAAWNAVTATDGQRPEGFPARQTRAARRLRR